MLNTILPFNDFLYLLQLEEYDSSRYAKLLPRFFFRRNLQVRDTLKITKRIQQMRNLTLLLQLAYLTYTITMIYAQSISQTVDALLVGITLGQSIIIFCFLTPLFILITNLLMTPWYEHLKRTKEKQTAAIIQQHPDLKIIAITGSYGKTTTKTALFELLKNDYRVQYTPGNINTSTGIAQWLIDKLQPNTQILIIEMDAYKKGEIARSCTITPPNTALITNFGDQHLERFGNHENLTLAYLEAFTQAAPSAKLLINNDQYQKAKQHQSTQEILNKLSIQTYQFNATSTAVDINIHNATVIAQQLGISQETINLALPKIQPPDRRGDIKVIDGYTVIDRSYNISESTAKQGILEASALAKQQNKDLIIITAGIPERGKESEEVNTQYGQFIKDYAKHIIVLQSIYAPAITAGINQPSKVYKATRMHEALKIAKSFGKPSESIILMQPELTDLSY